MQDNMQGGGKKSNGVLVGTIVAVIIAVAAYGFYKYTQKNEGITSEPIVTTPTPQAPTPSPVSMFTYKDGTYSAIGNYNSPGGAETIKVELTLKDDKISAITVTPQATRPESKVKQAAFAGGYKVLVLGKSIDEVSLDKVSGSSLTPKGFMDAVTKIKVQAKA